MKIKVEYGIPIPQPEQPRPEGLKKILRDMKPGGSFVWRGKSISNVYLYARMAGVKILVRTVRGGSKRVWKIK